MKLIRKTKLSNSGNCPAVYADGDSFVVVGKTIRDAAVVGGLPEGVGDDETAVRVPADVLAELAVAKGF